MHVSSLAGSPEHTSQHKAILEILLAREACSRSELSRLTGISPAAVSEAVSSLIADEWIFESGEDVSTGGRPPVLLSFNRTARAVLAVGIHPHRIEAALFDLHPESLGRRRHRIAHGDDVLQVVYRAIDRELDEARENGHRVLAISVSVPGTVNAEEGSVGLSTPMDWVNLPLSRYLHDRYDLPVHVENDANLAAIAESRYGVGVGDPSLVYITTAGTGGGILIDRRIYHGGHGAAGEIGHMSIHADGERCVCGNRGCLALYASEMALELGVVRRIKQGAASMLSEQITESGEHPAARDIMEAAQSGDRVASAALDDVADALAVGINNIVNLFDISLVIIGGSFMEAGDAFMNRLRTTFLERAHTISARTVRIVNAAIRSHSPLLGCVAAAFERTAGLTLSPAHGIDVKRAAAEQAAAEQAAVEQYEQYEPERTSEPARGVDGSEYL